MNHFCCRIYNRQKSIIFFLRSRKFYDKYQTKNLFILAQAVSEASTDQPVDDERPFSASIPHKWAQNLGPPRCNQARKNSVWYFWAFSDIPYTAIRQWINLPNHFISNSKYIWNEKFPFFVLRSSIPYLQQPISYSGFLCALLLLWPLACYSSYKMSSQRVPLSKPAKDYLFIVDSSKFLEGVGKMKELKDWESSKE